MKKKSLLSLLLVAGLGLATTSTVVSCKDYDDDISSVNKRVDDLNGQLKTLQDALAQCKSECAAAHATFVTKTELNQTKDALTALAQQAAATAKAEAIAEAIAQCKSLIAGKADQADLDKLATRVASIEETLLTLKDYAKISYVDAADKNLQDQIDAIKGWKALIDANTAALKDKADVTYVDGKVKELNDLISDLSKKVGNLETDMDALKKQMNDLSKKVDDCEAKVNVLSVLVNKMLTSISLVPDLYYDGIEAIQFKSLMYYPTQAKSSGYLLKENKAVRRDAGEAEATYRLSPNSVDLNTIGNYQYLAAISDKVESRAVSKDCPVEYAGIKSYDASQGLLTVNLKKTTTESLNRTDGKIWIVALKVDRLENKEKGQEKAEIYSENDMLIETTFTPQIADATCKFDHRGVWWDNGADVTSYDPTKKTEYGCHFLDYESVYGSDQDADALVYKTLQYDQAHDLSKYVVACESRNENSWSATSKAAAWENRIKDSDVKHKKMSIETLKKYGITVRYSIPTDPYLARDAKGNETDQQKFAVIDPVTGVIKSALPHDAATSDNRAVIDKEPIVCIQFVDTVAGNNIVDERYMKIKWGEEEVKPVELTLNTITDVLNCEEMSGQVTWEEFIKIYSEIVKKGVSHEQFASIYSSEPTGFKYSYVLDNNTCTDAQKKGSYAVTDPIIRTTVYPGADAWVAKWTLTPDDVRRVYFDAQSNTKTFTVTFTLKSSMRHEYPDLKITWSFKITLPTLPGTPDKFANDWIGDTDVHYVLPVQYGTATYSKSADVINFTDPKYGERYCVYNYSLTGAFKNQVAADKSARFIVKDIYNNNPWIDAKGSKVDSKGFLYDQTCYSYDIQFNKPQTVMSAYSANYDSKAKAVGVAQDVLADQPRTAYADFLTNDIKVAGADYFGGYDLVKATTALPVAKTPAAEIYWEDQNDVIAPYADYEAWRTPLLEKQEGKIQHMNARLFLNHYVADNQALLNPLGDKLVTSDLDQKRPEYSSDKKVDMTVWVNLNAWNYVPVKKYQIAIVAPLKINVDIQGKVEDGHVTGEFITIADALNLTDFRGYLVAETKQAKPAGSHYNDEQLKYQEELWKYYEVEGVTFDLNNIKYTLKDAGNVVVDNNLTYDKAMTKATLLSLSAGKKDYSFTYIPKSGTTPAKLQWKNLYGDQMDQMFYALIPCKVTYGFGELNQIIKVPIYPNQDKK